VSSESQSIVTSDYWLVLLNQLYKISCFQALDDILEFCYSLVLRHGGSQRFEHFKVISAWVNRKRFPRRASFLFQ
jgi:hypothetical protein